MIVRGQRRVAGRLQRIHADGPEEVQSIRAVLERIALPRKGRHPRRAYIRGGRGAALHDRRRVGVSRARKGKHHVAAGLLVGQNRPVQGKLRGVWMVLLLALGSIVLLCGGGALTLYLMVRPHVVVERTQDFPSPDGQWQATLEWVDNGMGFGLGVLYHEVHVHKRGSGIWDHGEEDSSAVFYDDSEKVDPPRIAWIGDRHLLIEYQTSRLHWPGRKAERLADVTIEYRAVVGAGDGRDTGGRDAGAMDAGAGGARRSQ